MTTTPWSARVEECRDQFSTERNESIRRELLGHVDETPLMDVGCGSGELEKHLDGEYIGVDVTLEFDPDVHADATDLPFPDNHTPTVAVKNTLQHIPDWRAAVAECCRVASDRVVAVERTHDEDTQVVADEPCLRRRFHQADLRAAFAEAGAARICTFRCTADDRLSIVVGAV